MNRGKQASSGKLILLALLVNAGLYALLLLFFHPIYNSREDAHALYLLTGSFGDSATAFLHYNYGLNPLLGFIILNLFKLTSNINWYSISLLVPIWLLGSSLLYQLLLKRNRMLFLPFMVLFVVFQGWLITYPDFTNASMAMSTCGVLLLIHQSGKTRLSFTELLPPVLCFFVASLYRVHSIVPIVATALPFIIVLCRKENRLKILAALGLALLMIFAAHAVQEKMYEDHDKSWTTEEQYRQAVYSYYNHQNAMQAPDTSHQFFVEQDLVEHGLLVDRTFLSRAKLAEMQTALSVGGPAAVSHDWLKWFWYNNRLFILTCLLFLSIYSGNRRLLITAGITIALLALAASWLVLKAKLPDYLVIAPLMTIAFIVGIHGTVNRRLTAGAGRIIQMVLMFAFIGWGSIRLYRTDRASLQMISYWKQSQSLLAHNPDKLFISTGNFPLHAFYIFDNAGQLALPNYLDSEHFINENYRPALNRFGMKEFADIPATGNVYFWGMPSKGLIRYLENRTGRRLSVMPVTGMTNVYSLTSR